MSGSESARLAAIVSGIADKSASKARTPQRNRVRSSPPPQELPPTFGNSGTAAVIYDGSVGPFDTNIMGILKLTVVVDGKRLEVQQQGGQYVEMPNLHAVIRLAGGIDYLDLEGERAPPEGGYLRVLGSRVTKSTNGEVV